LSGVYGQSEFSNWPPRKIAETPACMSLDAWWSVVNWEAVAARYARLKG
jgi:hypothetical protein